MERTAIVVEGGAMRGIFACGILDGFIREDFYPFDLCIGTSAGANNLAAYLAKMAGRNYKVYTDYSLRPEFMSLWRLVRGGHLMDLDWMWDVTKRELPIDNDTLFAQPSQFLCCATDCESGQAVYLEPNADNLFTVLKASSALPGAYRNTVTIDGQELSDGGVADSIPVREAYRRGARKILVLRSQKRDFRMTPSRSDQLMAWTLRDRPALARAFGQRPQNYQAAIDFIRQGPADAHIIEICPPESFAVGRTTTDLALLQQGYQLGEAMAGQIIAQWQAGEAAA